MVSCLLFLLRQDVCVGYSWKIQICLEADFLFKFQSGSRFDSGTENGCLILLDFSTAFGAFDKL